MATLSGLSDKQNLLLTQLAYESDKIADIGNGLTLSELASQTNGETAKILKEMCDAGLGDLRIKDVGNDPITGFGAIAFEDESGNVGFSYRGTDGIKWESANDWVDNVETMLTGTSPQTVQAEAFFDRNKDSSGNNYLYGHSKGGELSESVFVNNYDDIQGVHLYNPQPINPYSLTADQLKAIRSDKVDIVINEKDYVWFLGALPSYGNVRIIKCGDGNSHTFGSIRYQFDEDGNIIEGEMPWWEYVAYFAISGATALFQMAGAGIGLIYNSVVRVVDFVKNDLIPKAKEFIAWVSEKVKGINQKLKEYADNLKEFLGGVIDKAKSWVKNNLNQGYKYATANPEIIVDTYKLRNYADRLQSVNKRITNLDRRLDSLYWKVGLLDLWKLMQADMLTGYSWRLNRCVAYLKDAASDFESAESNINNSL